jgi:predicted TIM-barrel fold metal-dependent hydrolase
MCDVISADSHLDFWYLPGDLFTSEAPAEWKDRMPRVEDTPQGKAWVQNGKVLRHIGDTGLAAFRAETRAEKAVKSIRVRRKEVTGLYADAQRGVLRPGVAELRIKDEELDGVGGEVIYGILGLSRRINDPLVMHQVYKVYNDFVYQFRKADPGRFAPLACIPNHDTHAAAEELRRVAKMGFTGAELIISDSVKPAWDEDWDEIWEAADETRIPISFHNQGNHVRAVPADDPHFEVNSRRRNAVNQAVGRLGSAEFLASIIYSGAFDRFPSFRVVLGEASIGWIPYVLQRMDYEYEEEESFHMRMRLKPSEYFRSNCFATYERDAIGVRLWDVLGEDNIMWGSDYPHPDGTWPESQKFLEREFDGIPEKVRRKIVHDNAAKLYHLN